MAYCNHLLLLSSNENLFSSQAYVYFFLPPRFILLRPLANVFTIVGFPPGLPAARFLRIADFLSEGVIRAAFAAGTHFGYFFLPALLRPHFSKPPPFFGLEISTHFSPNHFVSPVFAILLTMRGQFAFYKPFPLPSYRIILFDSHFLTF